MLKFVDNIYSGLIKPILFSMSPDRAHSLIMSVMAWAGKVAPLRSLAKKMFGKKYPQLKTEFCGMKIDAPVGLSAGLDKNGQIVPIVSSLGFGFSEVGSVTAEKCIGNDRPWFYRLPKNQSLVVHAGLANKGADVVLANIKNDAKYYSSKFPVIMSIARNNSPCVVTDEESIADYIRSAIKANRSLHIKMIEINISCPNAFGGEQFTRPDAFNSLLDGLMALKIKKPIIIKMPSDLSWQDFKKLIDIALAHKINIFSISNLAKDRNLVSDNELPSEIKGGMSGKLLQKISDDLIRKTYKQYGEKVTIIGIGGIFNADDAYRKIKLGASYVELITGMIYCGPQLVAQINQGLVERLQTDGFKHISEAVGVDVNK